MLDFGDSTAVREGGDVSFSWGAAMGRGTFFFEVTNVWLGMHINVILQKKTTKKNKKRRREFFLLGVGFGR